MTLALIATGIYVYSWRQNCPSSFNLDGFHWCTAVFKSDLRFSRRLSSGLWLGHPNTFKCFFLSQSSVALAVFRVIVLQKGEPPSQSQLLGRLKQVFLLCILHQPPVLQFWLVSQYLSMTNIPTAWWYHHVALWGWCSGVMRGVGFTSDVALIDCQKFNFGFIWPEYLLPGVWVHHPWALWQTPDVNSCFVLFCFFL